MRRLHSVLLASSCLMPLALGGAIANPLGGNVVAGSATIQNTNPSTVTVTQSSDRAVINWNTFNIARGELTRFIQPNTSSIALNRVTGGLGPSEIYGSLQANGRVFVVNPDGILIGPGAKIDTAGFLATTHDITNQNFMAGRFQFNIPGRADASIVNQGSITASGQGFAALVAPSVRNTGTITAQLGKISLAAGNSFTLDLYGDRLIQLSPSDSVAAAVRDVATGQPLTSLVSNDGTLRANGGRVELSAVTARRVLDSVINNRGVIEANSVGQANGVIVLGAPTAATKVAGAPKQTIKISGTLSASGRRAGERGGTVQITGEAIELAGATIDASGSAGGGTILIGGDTGGGRPSSAASAIAQAKLEGWVVPTATTVSIDANTKIDASAKDTGDGGKVIAWADQAMSFYGTILARGGAQFGNGGFVEVSGHEQLAFNGTVDTRAPNGRSGSLLLDPLNATIDTAAGASVITVSAIQTALASNDVVVVSTNAAGSEAGDITVAKSLSWNTPGYLVLAANRNITINNGVTITGGVNAGGLTLQADGFGTGVGTVTFLGTGKVDFSQSSGAVVVYYNPPGGYANPTNYSNWVTTNPFLPGQLTAYMLVNNVNDLQNVSQNLSGTYALGRDIDASATVNWNGGAGFVPIGAGAGFSGSFNGMGHTVDRLAISSSFASAAVGLFGVIGASGTIQNVGITNADIMVSSPGVSASVAGALAGYNQGTISRSYATGTIRGTGGGLLLSDFGTRIGGLVGLNAGTITQSYANTAVSDTSGGAGYIVSGGLVGVNQGTILQSYALGSVYSFYIAGGLVGVTYPNATIQQSYSAAPVSSNNIAGGLVGLQYLLGPGTYSSNYWNVDTGGAIDGLSTGSSALTTAQLKSGLPSGFDPSVWAISSSVNSGYPYLKWQTPSGFGSLTVTTLLPGGGGASLPTDLANLSSNQQTTQPTSPISWQIAGPTTPAVLRTIPSSNMLLDPNELLTWPAIEGIVEAGLSQFTKLLPPDLAGAFRSDLALRMQGVLGNSKLTIAGGGLTVVGIALGDVATVYIDKLTNRAMSDCGGGLACAAVVGTARYGLQVATNSAIDYVTTPALWKLGLPGVEAAIGAGVVQSTVGNLIDLFRSNW